MLGMGLQLKLPDEQRRGDLVAARPGQDERVTDAQVFGAEHFLAVARFEIKMVEPGGGAVLRCDRQFKLSVFHHFADAADGKIIVVEGKQVGPVHAGG